MTSTLIVYEDAYYDQIHGLVKALRKDLGRAGSILEGEPGRGTGQFENVLGPLLRKPLKQTRAGPDRVICVADADRPSNLEPRGHWRATAPGDRDRRSARPVGA